jgi:uncharacterized membrane protein
VTATLRRFRPARATTGLVLVSLAILGILAVLPPLGPTLEGRPAVTAWHGRVTALLDPHRPDPSGTGGGFLPDARVLLLEGPEAGREVDAYRQGPGGQQDSNAYKVGEDVVVSSTALPDGGSFVAIEDRWRLPQLLGLTALFAAAVIAVGGWRGMRALLGLGLTVALLLKVLVPLLVAGVPPIPVAVVVATALTVLVIGLTEGLGRASVAAMLGTAAALTLTAILAAVVTVLAGFTNTLGSELVGLALPNGEGLDLRGILLAAFMIGSIGVLDDVTVTQATAVDELARAGVRGRELSASALAIGRSHIAATVNTLFLAYAGASLPLLILLAVGNQPLTLLLNGETIAIEIVRTMVGSLGIVAAVPLTTLIAAWLAGSAQARAGAIPSPARGRADRRPAPALALVAGLAALAVVTALAAAILGPLTSSGPRTPVPPDRFGDVPSAPAGGSAAPSEPPGSSGGGPAASGLGPGGVPTFDVGEAIPVFDSSGTQAGTVTVAAVDPLPTADGGLILAIEFQYDAIGPIAIPPETWAARTSSGEHVVGAEPIDPAAHPPLPRSVAAETTTTGWLEFQLPGTPDSVWVGSEIGGVAVFAVVLY